MKRSLWWWLLLPAVIFSAGVKAGIEYSKGHYVSKDRKFIEGEVVGREEKG